MGSTNYDWASLVMVRCSPPITPTPTNTGNFTRWMGAENPRNDWWHLNNPLNCGLNDGSADGEGSYANLDIAATETAQVLSQSNMAPIANALRADASLALGLNTHDGVLTNAPVAESLGYESQPLADVLG